MAYAATISLKLTLQNILLHPHRYSIPCEKKDLESFYEKFEFLQRFMEEYPSHERGENATFMERRIRDAAYEAEDLMNLNLNNPSHLMDFLSFVIKAINYLRDLVAAFKNGAFEFYPYKKEIIGRINIKLMIKKVDCIIDDVTNIKEQMGLQINQGRGSFKEEEIKIDKFHNHKDFEPRNAFREESSKLVSSDTKSLVVGFDDHLMQIKDQLTGPSSALKVISIVGMAGIGKTTLATHIYNDPSVAYQFDVRAWATVSQSYSVRDILLGVLESMKKLTDKMFQESDDRLGLFVYKNLKGQRYLIIVDDIWDTSAWDDLKMMFPDDKTGSRIMLTTRIANVAAYASPSGTLHQITLLRDEQSWMLLRAKVFGDEPCPLNIQKIGKTIAHNCRGLPLSIVVIGGLLSKVEKTQMAWQSIAENVTSLVISSDDQCSGILRLSYKYLPQYLKACFLYMAAFPKSHDICASKLTQMWVAEGFLRKDHDQSSEDVADRCLKELLDRRLILMSKKNCVGKIKTFRIHDLLLDLCVKEAKDENFLHITESPGNLFPTSSASERRISIHRVEECKHCQFIVDSMSSASYVRSLVCVGGCCLSSNLFLRFKLLRVLDATEVRFLEFPPQVVELLNLRYVALNCNGHVPASITKLWSLQTLIIARKWYQNGEIYLPAEIWVMSHLRHLRCDRALLLDPAGAKFKFYREHLVLEDLHTLSGFQNLIFSKEILQIIQNIKKIDVLYDCDFWENECSDYQLENLGKLNQLKALRIRALPDLSRFMRLISPQILKCRFPPSLKTLTLGGVGIPWHDFSIIDSLPKLEVLKLKDLACLGTEWEPNEGEFCKLKVLVLQGLEFEHWKADSNHFPSLQRLIIRYCFTLVEIPSGMGESTTLNMIELVGCKDSVWASANEIMEKQLSYGNDGFEVISADPTWNVSEKDLKV